MTVQVVPDELVVVESEGSITIVTEAPGYIVTEVETDVTVVTKDTQLTVIALETNPTVVPVNEYVTVIANEGGYVGPQIFVQHTAPAYPAVGDVWIVTPA